MLTLTTPEHKWEKGKHTSKAILGWGTCSEITAKNRKRLPELPNEYYKKIPKQMGNNAKIKWINVAAALVWMNIRGRGIRRKAAKEEKSLNCSFGNTRAFLLQQQLLTNDRLHIFRVVIDVEEVTCSQGIVQRFLKSSQVVKHFGSN